MIDYKKDVAIAGYDPPEPYAKMVCIGRYIRGEDNSAEIGIVVKEDYQGMRVGIFLTECLLNAAKHHGVSKLCAYVGYSNVSMLNILRKQGFTITESKKVDGHFVYLNLKTKCETGAKILYR